MAKVLTPLQQEQLDTKIVRRRHVFKIEGTDETTNLISYQIRADRSFGTLSAVFVMKNVDGARSPGNSDEIKIGDEVELIEYFGGDTTPFPKFFGLVRQRSVNLDASGNTISLNCLDLVVKLQETDIDLVLEGARTKIENETLDPQFLPAPNDMFANVFNFRNQPIAQDPPATIVIREKHNRIEPEPQVDGFEILHDVGQVKFGTFIQARDNFSVQASYNYFITSLHVEDMIERLFTEPDANGFFFFGAASKQVLIDDHLTTTLYDSDGKTSDTLIPNPIDQEVSITTELLTGISPGVTSIGVKSTDGFPSSGPGSGTATVQGDVFTWTGKSGNNFTGIPATGENSLKGHHQGDIVKYTKTYNPGEIWFLTYSRIDEPLSASEFTVPGGATIQYIDLRKGMIILNQAISTNSVVTLNRSYKFRSIQATGIEITRIDFRERKIGNRFEALEKLRQNLPPNYILQTRGNNKIWGRFIAQKLTHDYTLQLPVSLQYLDDEEVFTRVVIFGTNESPTNLSFGEDVAFVDTGVTFTATASNAELTFEEDSGNFRVYKTAISDLGKIVTDNVQPSVTVNGIPINDRPQEILGQQVTVDKKIRVVTETRTRRKKTEVRTTTLIFYTVKLPHTNIDRDQSIKFFDAGGTLLVTLSPNDANFSYEGGEWPVPGDQENETIEKIASADYHVRYSTDDLEIDFELARFRISKRIIPAVGSAIARASFDYVTAVQPIRTGGFALDGRFDTQVQTIMSAAPSNLPYAILDLGEIKTIQAIDIVAGFFKPDPDSPRRFDINMTLSIFASRDNVSYNPIDAKLSNFRLTGGESVQFGDDVLGEGFEARFLRLDLNQVEKVEFRDGVWPVAFTEVQIFDDIRLRSEAKLIPNTKLTSNILSGAGTIPVVATKAFPQTGSGFINGVDKYDYTSLTATEFGGVTGLDFAHNTNERVSQTLENDTNLFDESRLLEAYGDKVFKDTETSEFLRNRTLIDKRSKTLLRELTKNHSRVQAQVMYGPHYEVGDTVRINDPVNLSFTDQNYFIEAISDDSGTLTLSLARYEADRGRLLNL